MSTANGNPWKVLHATGLEPTDLGFVAASGLESTDLGFVAATGPEPTDPGFVANSVWGLGRNCSKNGILFFGGIGFSSYLCNLKRKN